MFLSKCLPLPLHHLSQGPMWPGCVLVPLELLQRAAVGGGRGGGRVGLQAVGEGVEVLHQEAHHQHVLLCGAEGLLGRQAVTWGGVHRRPIRAQPSVRKQPACHHGATFKT